MWQHPNPAMAALHQVRMGGGRGPSGPGAPGAGNRALSRPHTGAPKLGAKSKLLSAMPHINGQLQNPPPGFTPPSVGVAQ